MVSFEMIVGAKEQKENVSWHGKIDRNGRFYHVTQRAANRDFIFDKEIGQYRHNLLCRICSQFNVKIIFSVTMSNHTHDVLVANDIDDIAKVIRLVNTSVSHKLRKKVPGEVQERKECFRSPPTLQGDKIDR